MIGKPRRRRWEDAVKKDSRKILKLTGWRSLASDTQHWTGKLQETKAPFRTVAPQERKSKR